ncbi:RDD family protein [Synechococcus sp. Nb3U1]|uniref:RDD family protein n=1 Tax=Synechococcus sp. Nb3U1 TaxID=1914529 RepID=UPI001F33120B|nr:RDD family protein [Synechococcus sp. Nb3U1]MCF2971067.1 RDD family protein [Synechococcus sp. Nb3U1]
MTDPRPYPERPKFPERPKTDQLDQRSSEWQTLSALPTPAPLRPVETERPAPQTATAPQTAPVETIPKLASWRKRIGAFALDFGVGLGASYLAQGLASLFGANAGAVDMTGYVAFFAVWLVNRGYFQSRPEGQSLGKWLLNIKTLDPETETSPHLIRSLARESVLSLFLLTEALLVPLAADGLFAAFDKEKRQTIHDRAGRTLVVEAEQGYHLDEKAMQFLQGILEGDAAEDVKSAARDLLSQAQRNDTVRDLSKQVQRLGKDMDQNTRSLRQQTGKQVKNWVDSVKEKLDNW